MFSDQTSKNGMGPGRNGRIRNVIGRMIGKEAGFTLVELLVTLAIVGFVIAGAYQMYIKSLRTSSVQDQVADMQQNLRVVMDQMMRELRLAGYDPNAPTGRNAMLVLALPATTINLLPDNGETFSFQGDFDDDSVVEILTYDIRTLDGKPWLYREIRNEGEATGELAAFAANIESLSTTFYDDQNALTLAGAEVRRVDVGLTARTERPDQDYVHPVMGDGFRRRTVNSDVVLRNMGQAFDQTPPECPTSVNAAAGADCRIVQVSWNRPSDPDGDLAGYYLLYAQTPAAIDVNTSPFINIPDEGPGTPVYNYELAVDVDDSWNIGIVSYDNSGNLCDADTGTPGIQAVIASGSPVSVGSGGNLTPNPPTNALADPGDATVTVNWGQVTSNVDESDANDLAGYRLFRATQADFSDEVQLADETTLPITRVYGGGQSHTTQYVDNAVNSGAAGGPLNCSTYYYRVSVVDNCGLESAPTAVTTILPDGSSGTAVTPPGNGQGPPKVIITEALAGDDTSSIIIRGVLPPKTGAETDPVAVRLYWRVRGDLSWPEGNTNPPAGGSIEYPLTPEQIAGEPFEKIQSGLTANTWYEVKFVSLDDSSVDCGDSSDSTVFEIFTGACAPRLDAGHNASHQIFAGVGVSGIPLPNDNTAVIGLLSPLKENYMTWTAEPSDCSPDSSIFGPQGFDYKNPPDYTEVAEDGIKSAHVAFDIIHPDTAIGEVDAHMLYGDQADGINPGNGLFGANSLNIDYAPRGGDGFYHFPTDPISPSHLNTMRFCDGRYEFKATAVDGEQFSVSSIIPVEIQNGGIEIDPEYLVTTDTVYNRDIHHIVRFGIHNTNPRVDFDLTKITFAWENLTTLLNSVTVRDYNNNPIGRWSPGFASPSKQAGIGNEITFGNVPTLYGVNNATATNPNKAIVTLDFRNAFGSISLANEMRPDNNLGQYGEVSILSMVYNNIKPVIPGLGVCTPMNVGSFLIPNAPLFNSDQTRMDQPAPFTTVTQDVNARLVPGGVGVNITAEVFPGLLSPSDVKVHYMVDTGGLSYGPPRDPGAGGGGNYDQSATGTYDAASDTWNIKIPPPSDSARIFFYLEATEGDPLDPRFRNFDIIPPDGGFGYTQCGLTGPKVNITTAGGNALGIQPIDATVDTLVGLKFAPVLEVIQDPAAPLPPNGPLVQSMCRGSGGTCNPGLSSWTAEYDSDDADKKQVKHSVRVTATDACGNVGFDVKGFNN
ncbi:MAG TPA: prepilin-type N-terminal cleavage/methylation domain-containing protein [Nitrospiria bacterium]